MPRSPHPRMPTRMRISGKLLSIGDTVFVNNLGYNGTIMSFTRKFVVLLPHDYGSPIRCLPHLLSLGVGLSELQRQFLLRLNIPCNDPVKLDCEVIPHPSRRPSPNRIPLRLIAYERVALTDG